MFKRKNYAPQSVMRDLLSELYLETIVEYLQEHDIEVPENEKAIRLHYHLCTELRTVVDLRVSAKCCHGALDAKIQAAGYDLDLRRPKR